MIERQFNSFQYSIMNLYQFKAAICDSKQPKAMGRLWGMSWRGFHMSESRPVQ